MNDLCFSLPVKPMGSLKNHPVSTIRSLHPRKPVIRVRNDQFKVEKVDCSFPNGILFFGEQKEGWQQAGQRERSLFNEGILTALYVLYVLNIPSGECVVQRESSREYSVYQVRSFHHKEPSIQVEQGDRMTFGADVECLLQNRKTGRFVSATSLLKKNGGIGYDDAIALKGNQVIHPILELRPKPADSVHMLHAHLLRLYEKVERHLHSNHLRAVTTGFGRFQVGGHLHVGGCSLTFHHVRLLDVFFAIPYALIEFDHPEERRKRFGKLGSVRHNSFSGFEYRVLSSWYHMVPEFLPVLEWFSYILRHGDYFPALDFSDEMITGYYDHQLLLLQKVAEELEDLCRDILPKNDFSRYGEPFFQLIREKGIML